MSITEKFLPFLNKKAKTGDNSKERTSLEEQIEQIHDSMTKAKTISEIDTLERESIPLMKKLEELK